MDTGYDFLQPEFLNILFFQQKSLVVFPYVDLKHLKALEVFCEGYNVINIDATALHDVSSIISHETQQEYSLKPVLYFIINATPSIIADLMEMPEVRCIINTSENVESLVREDSFIFYNKKNKQFLNYDPDAVDLSIERELLQEAMDEHVLLQKLSAILSTAAALNNAVNEHGFSTKIHSLLEPYDPSWWKKILDMTARYYGIEIPDITIPAASSPKPNKKKALNDFSTEYQAILRSNRKIGQEFIQALHDYRLKKVNPAHLEVEQLFYPEQLYNYLRNHHWEKGIPQEFIDEWVLMKNTGHSLTEDDLLEFEVLFHELGFSSRPIPAFRTKPRERRKEEANQHRDPLISPQGNDSQSDKAPLPTNVLAVPAVPMVPQEQPAVFEALPPPLAFDSFSELKHWILKALKRLEERVFSASSSK